jgi:integrase
MASTSILLKDPNGEGNSECRLVCQLRDGREIKIIISTGISIKRKHWNKWLDPKKAAKMSSEKLLAERKVLRAKPWKIHAAASGISDTLKQFEKDVLKVYLSNKGKVITASFIQDEIDKLYKVEEVKSQNEVIESLFSYRDSATGKSKDYIRGVDQLVTHFKNFIKLKHLKSSITFEDLNLVLLESYHNYLTDETGEYITTKEVNGEIKQKIKTKTKLKSSTAKRHFTHLREAAKRYGTEVNKDLINYSIAEVNVVSRALKWDELKLIMSYNPISKAEELTKDIFLFLCFSGLRISACQKLRSNDIANGFINWVNTKNDNQNIVSTTIHKYNAEIIRKYKKDKGVIFPYIPQQILNATIKKIATNLDISRPDEIHNHTGRHSYNSLLYALGVDTFIRNEELGHTHSSINEKVYTKIDEQKRKNIIINLMDNIESILELRTESVTTKYDNI